MAQSFYRGHGTYVIFAEDSAFGTPGIPTGTNFVDKVTSFTGNVNNNTIRVHGIGEGRNATQVVNGILDVTGSMAWELTDPAFLQYCFVGTLAGSGTAADPFEVQEVDQFGYTAGQVNTLTLEVGREGGADDDVMTYDGVVINTFTIGAIQGETVKASAEWIGRTVNSSTTIESYTPPPNRPFTFIDGSATIGTDAIGALTGFSLVCANNVFVYRTMGSRLINQPVTGVRRYDFTLTMKLHKDDASNTLDALEARAIVFDGTLVSTTPTTGAESASVNVSWDLVEGASSGDRVVNFDLETCFLTSISQPVILEDGATEITITGFGLKGLTDGANQVPVRFFTVA